MAYKIMAKNKKQKTLASAIVYLPILALGAWAFSLGGCSLQERKGEGQGELYECKPQVTIISNTEVKHSDELPLVTEWNEIYDTLDTTIDESVDMEVWGLREKLNPHGITVFRVDPYNPQHRKRYERHLMAYPKKDPSKKIMYQQYRLTDWQTHKAHVMPSNGTLYDDDCPYCSDKTLERLRSLGI